MKAHRSLTPVILALAVFSAGAFAANPTGRIPLGPTTTPGNANAVYRIVSPGSYYLTENLVGVVGKSGIEIASSHVTLDLNGFALTGNALALDGVRVMSTADVEDITIRNGSADGWGQYGVNFYFNQVGRTGETAVIEHVSAARNLQGGIRASMYATIRHCTAIHNGSTGITAMAAATIDSSVSMGNAGFGIVLGGGVVRGCIASENLWGGISAGSGTSVLSCTSSDNSGNGFGGQNGVTFQGCTATRNDGFGFWVSEALVEGCVAQANQQGGVRTGFSSSVQDNTIVGTKILGSNSPAPGIMVDGAGNEVVGNTVTYSTTGIRVPVVQGTNGSNHIEANKLTMNDVGLKVENTVNFIVGNTARNTQRNYQIAAGNRVGTIVVPPVNNSAINGNSGGGSGTTDPWSNIAY